LAIRCGLWLCALNDRRRVDVMLGLDPTIVCRHTGAFCSKYKLGPADPRVKPEVDDRRCQMTIVRDV